MAKSRLKHSQLPYNSRPSLRALKKAVWKLIPDEQAGMAFSKEISQDIHIRLTRPKMGRISTYLLGKKKKDAPCE